VTQPSIVGPATVVLQLDPPALFDSAHIRLAMHRCGRVLERHSAYLTRLDAVLGDGDHGDNLSIGFRAVDDLLRDLPPTTLPGDMLRAVGHRLVAAVGGASGPLYGTAFIEAGFRAGDRPAIDVPQVAVMLQAAADGVARRGRCEVGDKTILDTLEPAARAFRRAVDGGRPVDEAWGTAVSAGWRGMLATRGMVARRGLALRLGGRSVGHLDPGAVSCLLLLRAFGGR
jgi:phosphoenolpyruvate---glycerone phosphotransferase subunit DhaL